MTNENNKIQSGEIIQVVLAVLTIAVLLTVWNISESLHI